MAFGKDICSGNNMYPELGNDFHMLSMHLFFRPQFVTLHGNKNISK